MDEIKIYPQETYLLRAKIILSLSSPPIFDGCVEIRDQRIVGIYPFKASSASKSKARFFDLEDLILFPALSNVHTHLELSALKFRLPPTGSFVNWVRNLLKKREELSPLEIQEGANFALQELWKEGVSVVGDVGNTGLTLSLLVQSPFKGYFFQEILCFKGKVELIPREDLSPNLRTTYSAHSAYTVTPIMLQAIKAYCIKRKAPFMIHCGESQEEVEFLKEGTGELAKLLLSRRRIDENYDPPGLSPIAYLERIGILDEQTILVHCVHVSEEDWAILKKRRPIICVCPKSNLFTGAGFPPVPRFLKENLRVVIGTDSLASVDRLSIFEEVRTLHSFYPEIPARTLLLMATKWGAEALGFPTACGMEINSFVDLLGLRVNFPLTQDPEKALIEFIQAEKEVVVRVHA